MILGPYMTERKRICLHHDLPRVLMLKWRNDPEIFKFTRQNSLIDESHHNNYLNTLGPTIKLFSIVLHNELTDVFNQIGICGFTSINHVNQTAEFSLYIAPEHQGRGYATKALITLFQHGFDALNLNRIWGETFEFNPAQHLFEKLGMVKEGTLRQSYFRNGKFIDSYIYSILRGEQKWTI